MEIEGFKTLFPDSETTVVAYLCYTPQYLFHLTGSCEDDVFSPKDVDVFIPDSSDLEKFLKTRGFLCTQKYSEDPFFTRVFEYKYKKQVEIHVQAVKPGLFMAKWQLDRKVHEFIRELPFEASKKEREEIYGRLAEAFWMGKNYEQ